MKDLHREFTYVSQLKYTEDSSRSKNKKGKAGGNEGYGFLAMEAQHKFKMKNLRNERESATGVKEEGEQAAWRKDDNCLDQITERDVIDEMGTVGNLD